VQRSTTAVQSKSAVQCSAALQLSRAGVQCSAVQCSAAGNIHCEAREDPSSHPWCPHTPPFNRPERDQPYNTPQLIPCVTRPYNTLLWEVNLDGAFRECGLAYSEPSGVLYPASSIPSPKLVFINCEVMPIVNGINSPTDGVQANTSNGGRMADRRTDRHGEVYTRRPGQSRSGQGPVQPTWWAG
jgi:hypothetical protein